MRIRPAELIAAAVFCCLGQFAGAQEARLESQFTWTSDVESHGGYSGLEISDDGLNFTAMTDRATMVSGRFERDGGRITGVIEVERREMKATDGGPITAFNRDAEGLAIRADGRIFVSFERFHRVWTYSSPGSEAAWIPRHEDFSGMQDNSSLEALAIDVDGVLYTLPERSGRLRRPFPIYRYRSGTWDQPFSLPRRGAFLAVGADIGPDGRFYLLEREVRSPFGLASRVRSFDISGGQPVDERVHFTSRVRAHDNLEGLAVWRDDAGAIRLTMVSDNNFNWFQRTEFVEYVLDQ
ncbi:MAG: esterase-like activity of phytase family protein [Rhodobacteraceae bacterium]|nr:esterase-like activity of phytase family protein [Paracoccaceae bacterium]